MLRRNERTERIDAPTSLELRWCNVVDRLPTAATRVVNQDADGAEVVANGRECRGYRLRVRGVTSVGARIPEFLSQLFAEGRAARQQRDAIALRSEAAGECGSVLRTDTDDGADGCGHGFLLWTDLVPPALL